MNVLEELRETFRQEAIDLLNELARILGELRDRRDDSAALVAARRIAHNLKGAAITVGAHRIAGPCHLLEDDLEIASKAKEPPSSDRVESWLFLVTELQAASNDPNVVAICFTNASLSQPGSAPTPEPEVSPLASPKPAEPTCAEVQGPAADQTLPTGRVATGHWDEVMAHAREVARIQSRLAEQMRALQICRQQEAQCLAAQAQSSTRAATEFDRVMRQLRQDIEELGNVANALSDSFDRARA